MCMEGGRACDGDHETKVTVAVLELMVIVLVLFIWCSSLAADV